MIRIALAGVGKMGLSHLAILRAHPELCVAAACDGMSYLTSNLQKYTGIRCYGDFDEMLKAEQLDAVLIATPSKAHSQMIENAIAKGLHVFCEKPFVLNVADGHRLVDLADQAKLVTQIGYHYRFVAAFTKAREVIRAGHLGRVHHVRAEAYGPVVLRKKGATWRSNRTEGGGVVYDYACHAIDLVNYVVGPVQEVSGVVRNSVFSRDVDDEVYCSFRINGSISGQLAANWSDESHRKMSTSLSVWGEKGSLKADRQECAIYLRDGVNEQLGKGWTILNTTALTEEVWYYLRGEEYSAQIDEFVRRIKGSHSTRACDFRAALETDRVVAMIHGEESTTGTEIRRSQRSPLRTFIAALRGSHG